MQPIWIRIWINPPPPPRVNGAYYALFPQSILFFSILLFSTAFQSMDDSLALGSLSLGPGDMPSINDMEQSISLPQFPSSTLGQGGGGALEQSISLPQFPSARGVTREGARGQDMLHMSSIDEVSKKKNLLVYNLYSMAVCMHASCHSG